MQRFIFAGLIGAALLVGRPAAAPAQPGPDNVKRIEAELEKVRGHMRELQAALEKAHAAGQGPERKGADDDRPMAKKKGGFGSMGGAGFGKKDGKGAFGGGFDPKDGEYGKKKDGKGPGAGFGKKKDGKSPWGDGPPFAKKKDGKGPWGEGPPWARKGPGQYPGFGGPPWARGGQGPWARGGARGFGGASPWARATGRERPGALGNRELERRLDHIMRELEELRRDISRR